MSGEDAGEFGALRALVNAPPAQERFAAICRFIQATEERAPGLYEEHMRAYVEDHLARWPATCRLLRLHERHVEEVARTPWGALARGLELRSSNLEDIASAREHFPALEHLSLRRFPMRKKELEAATSQGLFEGLGSISLWPNAVSAASFALLIERLEALDELEHLRLNHCSLNAKRLPALLDSGLPGRLRTLGLSDNRGLKSAGGEAIAACAAQCERLERLELRGCGLTGKAIKALASADWPDGLAHMALAKNPMKTRGLKALAEAGRLALLIDRQGPPSLDLSEQPMDVKGLRLLMHADALEGIERLNLSQCHLEDIEALATSPHLGSLRRLDLSYNGLNVDPDNAARLLTIVERARLEALILESPRNLGDAFVVELLAHPGAAELDVLVLNDQRRGYGPEALRAVLDWPGLARASVVDLGFAMPRGHELVARALATGLFEATEHPSLPDTLLIDPLRRRFTIHRDSCVHSDGTVPLDWLTRARR